MFSLFFISNVVCCLFFRFCVSNGVDNPGFIPDENQGEKELKSQCFYAEYSEMHPDAYVCKKCPRYRPTSGQSIWGDGIVKGPRQHFQAMETYFDCEFYIYGHKYQSKLNDVTFFSLLFWLNMLCFYLEDITIKGFGILFSIFQNFSQWQR